MVNQPTADPTSAPDAPVGVVCASAAGDALAGVEWHATADQDLVATMVQLERAQRLLDHARLEVARRLEESEAGAETLARLGWASAKDFLTAVSGGRKGAGSGLLRLAKRLEELPATRAALAAGAISRTQAQVIASDVSRLPRVPELRAAAETRLVEVAAEHDATDLAGQFRRVVADLDPDGTLLATDLSLPRQERAAHAQRYLALTPDTLGGVRIRGYTTVEDADLLSTTLIPLTAPVQTEPGACGGTPSDRSESGRIVRGSCPDPVCGHDGRDPREYGTRLHDALIEACRRLHTTTVLPHTHATPPRVVVTISLEDLRATPDAGWGTGEASLGNGPVSAGAARRMACDAELIPAVLGTPSQILDLGRSHRLVTPGLWHALVLRDQHCAFPGCTRLPIACDAHHIVHWADGGTTTLDNMLLLCRRHHTLTHHTPWTVTIDPDHHRPVWTPPPRIDDTGRYSRHPPQPAHVA